jgi:hypothetical protein
VYGLRPEYQDRVNFVILDVDLPEERSLAQEMGAIGQPFYAVIPPGAGPDQATQLRFGPLPEPRLRELLDGAVAAYRTE